MTNSTAFVDITDPINPIFLGRLDSNAGTSIWRDVKVYNNFAFIVADCSLQITGCTQTHGMQVFDLKRLRNIINPPETFTHDAILTAGINSSTIGNCHNIAINESVGVAYLVGCVSANGGGPIMVNISDPKNPVAVGQYTTDGYSHDIQVLTYTGPDIKYTNKQILVSSNGEENGTNKVVILDVTNPASPQKISEATSPNTKYIHQGWFSTNQKYFLVNDELDELRVGNNTRTLIFDFTDLDNPIFHSQFFNTTLSIDHNLYVKDNLVYQANYSSGLRVLDIADINNISEIGFFDTYPLNDEVSFNGAWSVYPYFASGNVIINDIERGLFIVRKSGTLSTEMVSLDKGFSIYPNPAEKNPIVKSSRNNLLELIEVYTILGQKVFTSKNIQQKEYIIPTESLVKGIYFVKINGNESRKLILK
jgi:choice-of-anchor B domain-containing protein